MRLNLTQKFLLPTIVGFALIAIVLGYVVNSVLRTAMIDGAKTFISDIITLQANEYFPDPSFFIPQNGQIYSNIYSHVYEAVKTKEVVRIKVWAVDSTIVYSDDNTIIGKKFSDDGPLQEALQGNITAEIVKPTGSERADVRAYTQLMELYVPIYYQMSPKPAGVIEIYYGLDSLNRNIASASLLVYGLMAGTFILLTALFYVLSNTVIISPLTSINIGIKEIEKGNLYNKIPVKSSDEIGRLAKALNDMTIGLKRLQELKNEFVFVAAHELRTPVTAIKGYISLIRDYPGLNLPSEVNEDLGIIAQAAKGLNQLVGDILEIARSDAGRLEIQLSECDIKDVVQTTIAQLAPLAKEKNLTLTYKDVPMPSHIAADTVRLKEVITNLISNAIKYNIIGGYITISHTLEGNFICTSVENNGMGIPKEEQSHIFEKFYRAEAAKHSEIVGTGLGLFITKELIERMKGNISFISEEGKRTVFTVKLPKWETDKT